MSSSLTKLVPPAPPTPPSRLLTPKTPIIPLLATSAARICNHAHAPLVLVYYVLRFSSLVSDPFNTMIRDLVPITIAQCTFCAVCLPCAGTWGSGGSAIISGTASGKSAKASSGSNTGSMRRKAGKAAPGALSSAFPVGAASWKTKVMPTILSLILALALPPLPLTLLALVQGAPLYPQSLISHTLLLSVHISLLAMLPLFYTHGVAAFAWHDIMAAWLPFDEAGVWGGFVGCMVGGWIGAVPMALDWDRDWQAWPVPVLTGAYLGWAVGRVLTADLKLGIGRRIDMSVESDQTDQREVPASGVMKKKE